MQKTSWKANPGGQPTVPFRPSKPPTLPHREEQRKTTARHSPRNNHPYGAKRPTEQKVYAIYPLLSFPWQSKYQHQIHFYNCKTVHWNKQPLRFFLSVRQNVPAPYRRKHIRACGPPIPFPYHKVRNRISYNFPIRRNSPSNTRTYPSSPIRSLLWKPVPYRNR